MNNIRVALTTCSDSDSAARLATQLIESGLAACVNIVTSVRSIYRWQGKIADDFECLLIIKTTIDRAADLQAAVSELHDYDVPEFIVLPVESEAQSYLDWVVAQTTAKK